MSRVCSTRPKGHTTKIKQSLPKQFARARVKYAAKTLTPWLGKSQNAAVPPKEGIWCRAVDPSSARLYSTDGTYACRLSRLETQEQSLVPNPPRSTHKSRESVAHLRFRISPDSTLYAPSSEPEKDSDSQASKWVERPAEKRDRRPVEGKDSPNTSSCSIGDHADRTLWMAHVGQTIV